MIRSLSKWHGLGVLALGLCSLGGCLHLEPSPTAASSSTVLAPESAPKLTPAQVADVKIAYGRNLEKHGALDQAQAAYLEALKLDPGRADACARLGVLFDQQCKFDDASGWHRKAVAAQPKNPDFHCNAGYGQYLRGNMVEAENSLRRCLALAPEHARAHNNLGLVLARAGRCEEALGEFRRAGCDEADAQSNLAHALTLEGRGSDARACYERALAVDPNSTTAQKGIRELDQLMAKADAGGRVAKVGATAGKE